MSIAFFVHTLHMIGAIGIFLKCTSVAVFLLDDYAYDVLFHVAAGVKTLPSLCSSVYLVDDLS